MHLSKLIGFDSLDRINDCSMYYKTVKAMIKNGNLTNKASVELVIYFIFCRQGDSQELIQMSLFTDFCLKMLDNRYFEMLKDMIEDFFANKKPTATQACHIVGLIRRIAQCEKIEYSAKLLDLV